MPERCVHWPAISCTGLQYRAAPLAFCCRRSADLGSQRKEGRLFPLVTMDCHWSRWKRVETRPAQPFSVQPLQAAIDGCCCCYDSCCCCYDGCCYRWLLLLL